MRYPNWAAHWAEHYRRNDGASSAPWLKSARKPTGPISDVDPWAIEAWRMWNQKEVRSVAPAEYDFPEVVFPVGRADRILYSADKWEEDGDFFTYYHDFDSHPIVYTEKGAPMMKGVRSNGQPLDVPDVFNVETVDDQWSIPVLAYVLELFWTKPDGTKAKKKFKKDTIMTCAEDLQTLCILSEDAPVFIRGGSMEITERGIVR